jgi:hypothetical protein
MDESEHGQRRANNPTPIGAEQEIYHFEPDGQVVANTIAKPPRRTVQAVAGRPGVLAPGHPEVDRRDERHRPGSC